MQLEVNLKAPQFYQAFTAIFYENSKLNLICFWTTLMEAFEELPFG